MSLTSYPPPQHRLAKQKTVRNLKALEDIDRSKYSFIRRLRLLPPDANWCGQTTCGGEEGLSIMGPEDGEDTPGNVIGVKTDLKTISS